MLERLYGDEGIIADGNYRLKVLLPIAYSEGVKEGEKVKIRGKFLYDSTTLSFYILATEVKRI